MSVKGYTIWSSVKMTSSQCCKNTEKEAWDSPWEAGRGERMEEEDGRRKDGEKEMRGRSQEGRGWGREAQEGGFPEKTTSN